MTHIAFDAETGTRGTTPDLGQLPEWNLSDLYSAPDAPERTIVGFYPYDTRRVELPFELDIDTGTIGINHPPKALSGL